MPSTTQTAVDRQPKETPHGAARARPLFDTAIVNRALVDSLVKLDPRTLMKNPVIFVVEVVSVMVTIRIGADIASSGPVAFDTAIAAGLWFTVLFANFAEAMAEGRGKAQADALRKTRADLVARRLRSDGSEETVPAALLRAGDLVMVETGN
jgi:K+-transporting ATPase ATPase B chain